jgi:hypothetical protein
MTIPKTTPFVIIAPVFEAAKEGSVKQFDPMQRATGVEPVRHPIAIDGDGRLTAISGTS